MSIYLTQTSRSAFFLVFCFWAKPVRRLLQLCAAGSVSLIIITHSRRSEREVARSLINWPWEMSANERAAAAVVVACEASALHKNVQIHNFCILRDFKLLSLLSLWSFVNLLSIKISPLRRRFSHELAIKFVGLSLSGENLSRVHIFQLMKRNATDLERSGEKRSCGNYWIYHFTLSHESNASLFNWHRSRRFAQIKAKNLFRSKRRWELHEIAPVWSSKETETVRLRRRKNRNEKRKINCS